MKKWFAIWITIAIYAVIYATPVPAAAEIMYVGDITKLNVRENRGANSNIIETLPSGEKVEVMTFSSGWTNIRLSDGTQGWVVSRYLSKDKPLSVQIEELKEQLESMLQKIEDLKTENNRLTSDNQTLTSRLDENMEKLAVIQSAYGSLKDDSKDYLGLKNKYDRLALEITKKTSRIKSLEQRVSDTYLSFAIKWFLVGAGVLLIGFLLGNRTKRKRSSLL
jgi:SH3 domain protein